MVEIQLSIFVFRSLIPGLLWHLILYRKTPWVSRSFVFGLSRCPFSLQFLNFRSVCFSCCVFERFPEFFLRPQWRGALLFGWLSHSLLPIFLGGCIQGVETHQCQYYRLILILKHKTNLTRDLLIVLKQNRKIF